MSTGRGNVSGLAFFLSFFLAPSCYPCPRLQHARERGQKSRSGRTRREIDLMAMYLCSLRGWIEAAQLPYDGIGSREQIIVSINMGSLGANCLSLLLETCVLSVQ